MMVKLAIKILVHALKSEGYRYSWQSNIAMAFYDECKRTGLEIPDLHGISDRAANNFLNTLMK